MVKKDIIFKIITIFLALILFLGIAEITTRVVYLQHDKRIKKGMRLFYSPLYGSIAEPGSMGIHKTKEYKVFLKANLEGFREKNREKSERDFISFLGDSYTWGTGVEEDHRFSSILRKKFNKNIFNYGLCTAGTINELAIFKTFIEKRKPSLVVLNFYPNDIQNNLWWCLNNAKEPIYDSEQLMKAVLRMARMPAFWPDQKNIISTNYGHTAFFYLLKNRYKKLFPDNNTVEPFYLVLADNTKVEVDRKLLLGDANYSAGLIYYHNNLEIGWNVTKITLSILKQLSLSNNFEFLITYIPYQEKIHPEDWSVRKKFYDPPIDNRIMDFDRPLKELKKLTQELDIDLLDLTPSMIANRKNDRLYYKHDSHLTVAGNKVVADALYQYISTNYQHLFKEEITD